MNPDKQTTENPSRPLRILSLDGGGAKGFYTLGVLDELERNAKKPIHQCFDLIFGTSTGAIIAALVARGDSVADVLKLYSEHVPKIMKPKRTTQRTAALRMLATTVFSKTSVADFKTRIGIVATNWKAGRPFIFKASVAQAHGSFGSFVPFFGCSVSDAVIGSCSAEPFFSTHTVTTSKGDVVELGDGGFCANNPTLYAIADATLALKATPENLRVVSVGVGSYPPPNLWKLVGRARGGWGILRHSFNSGFLQKILDTNTGSMEQLREIMFKTTPTIRINDSFTEPTMATDLLEHDLGKLNLLVQKGRDSYRKNEGALLAAVN